jgi:Na+-transporting NADH:ubiquinone oxidoreductase subunit A
MALHKISKGLNLPISGEPEQAVAGSPKVRRVAIVADDFPGMKPRMAVKEGDAVKRGQLLFENRKEEGVLFTSPGAGRVVGVHRGRRRALQSVVVELDDAEVNGSVGDAHHVRFERYTGRAVETLSREDVVSLLVESGMWTALRTRPFSKTPSPKAEPQALFINAAETNPLAPDPDVIYSGEPSAFQTGLKALTLLSAGPTFLCVNAGSKIDAGSAKVQREEFAGPHPAGTVGLHIHTLYPVSRQRSVWHLGLQDVIAIGKLFETGRLDVSRVVSIAGPPIKNGRLVKTRLGASVKETLEGDGDDSDNVRWISGSVLSGKKAMGDAFGYLGRFDQQISVLHEGNQRDFLGWLAPGAETYSTIPLFVSKMFGGKKFNFTTSTNGSARAMVPLGMYEKVMPLDILPTFLLRALTVGDVERAEQLGALELDEEDLALCTFVCPGKTNYGLLLRKNLQTIEEEG